MPSHCGVTALLIAMLAVAVAGIMQAGAEETGVCMLQHARSAVKSCISKHDDGQHGDLEAVGTAYKNVEQLIDRHHKLSESLHGKEHRGQELQEARQLHAAIGKSIKRIRQDSESLLELASRKGSSCELRSMLRGLDDPVGDLSKGLERLTLLQQKVSEKDALKRIAQQPDEDLAAVGKMYNTVSQLLDRHHFLSEQMGRADYQGQGARQLHAAVGKSIRSIRQGTESLLQLEAKNEDRVKLRSALKGLQHPVARLQTDLEGLAMLQEAADRKALGRLAEHQNEDVAAVGAVFQHVNGLIDRHHELLRQDKDGELSGHKLQEARKLHTAVGGAIRKIRKETESLLQLAAAPGGDGRNLHAALEDLRHPMQALQSNLVRLEQLHG